VGAASPDVPELDAKLHLPASGGGTKVPLLLMLHGLGASARDIESSSDWLAFADQHGIAWLAPSGPFDRQGRRFWNAGASCCNFDQIEVDHVAQLAALIERTVATPGIDRARVFVGGHSNGAFMAHRLACERPDLIHGVIALAGTGPLDPALCKRPRDLRVLQVHGDADPIVPYAGGHLFRSPSLPTHLSALETTRNWAGLLGCDPAPVARAPVDVEPALPGAETRVQSYRDCKAGKVELWTVVGGGHLVGFRSPAPAAIWAFLSE
jgi:polyhydroxybutyrate depolymerase